MGQMVRIPILEKTSLALDKKGKPDKCFGNPSFLFWAKKS